MTPEQFITAGVRLYGRKRWKSLLAKDIGVDVSTIHRITHRPQVPGPYEVALNAMVEQKKRQLLLEKEARKLIPRRLRKNK